MKRKILFITILLMLCLSTSLLMALPKVAVLDTILAEGMDKSLAVPITDKIMEELVNSKKYIVLDRNFVNEVLKEKEFQLSGMVKTDDIKKAGEYLGADLVVVARTTLVGDFFFVSARMIDVKSGAIVAQTSQEQRWDVSTLFQAASKVGNKLSGGVVDTSDAQINERESRAKELVKGKDNKTTTTNSTTTDTTTTDTTIKGRGKISDSDLPQKIQTNAIGVKVAFSSSQVVGGDSSVYWQQTESPALGFAASLYIEAGLSTNLSLGLEATYITKGAVISGSDYTYGGFTETWALSYFQVPILFKYRIPFSYNSGMHLGLGAFVGYALSAEINTDWVSYSPEKIDLLTDSTLSKYFDPLDYGVAINFDIYFSLGGSLQMLLGLDVYASINSIFTSDAPGLVGNNTSAIFYTGLGFSY